MGWQRRKHRGGKTEGSFVRQEAAETKAFSLGTVVEQREPWDMRKKLVELVLADFLDGCW